MRDEHPDVRRRRRFWRWLLGILAAVTLVAVGGPTVLCGLPIAVGVADLTGADEVTGAIVARSWTRRVEVEEWSRVTDEGWCSDVPVGVTIVDRTLRTARTGSGARRTTTTRSWCAYEQDRWVRGAPRIATGTGGPRTWPEAPTADACPVEVVGCVRRGPAIETLTVRFDAPGRRAVDCTVAESLWVEASVGRPATLPVSRVFGRASCDGLSLAPLAEVSS
ncbi:MAG: hypothetical protein ABMB14_08865 [Myxococcota bacterium]